MLRIARLDAASNVKIVTKIPSHTNNVPVSLPMATPANAVEIGTSALAHFPIWYSFCLFCLLALQDVIPRLHARNCSRLTRFKDNQLAVDHATLHAKCGIALGHKHHI